MITLGLTKDGKDLILSGENKVFFTESLDFFIKTTIPVSDFDIAKRDIDRVQLKKQLSESQNLEAILKFGRGLIGVQCVQPTDSNMTTEPHGQSNKQSYEVYDIESDELYKSYTVTTSILSTDLFSIRLRLSVNGSDGIYKADEIQLNDTPTAKIPLNLNGLGKYVERIWTEGLVKDIINLNNGEIPTEIANTVEGIVVTTGCNNILLKEDEKGKLIKAIDDPAQFRIQHESFTKTIKKLPWAKTAGRSERSFGKIIDSNGTEHRMNYVVDLGDCLKFIEDQPKTETTECEEPKSIKPIEKVRSDRDEQEAKTNEYISSSDVNSGLFISKSLDNCIASVPNDFDVIKYIKNSNCDFITDNGGETTELNEALDRCKGYIITTFGALILAEIKNSTRPAVIVYNKLYNTATVDKEDIISTNYNPFNQTNSNRFAYHNNSLRGFILQTADGKLISANMLKEEITCNSKTYVVGKVENSAGSSVNIDDIKANDIVPLMEEEYDCLKDILSRTGTTLVRTDEEVEESNKTESKKSKKQKQSNSKNNQPSAPSTSETETEPVTGEEQTESVTIEPCTVQVTADTSAKNNIVSLDRLLRSFNTFVHIKEGLCTISGIEEKPQQKYMFEQGKTTITGIDLRNRETIYPVYMTNFGSQSDKGYFLEALIDEPVIFRALSRRIDKFRCSELPREVLINDFDSICRTVAKLENSNIKFNFALNMTVAGEKEPSLHYIITNYSSNFIVKLVETADDINGEKKYAINVVYKFD